MFRFVLPWVTILAVLSGCATGAPQQESIEPAEPIEETVVEPQSSKQVPLLPPEVADTFLEPWPSDFTRRELADSALAQTYSFLDQRQKEAGDEYLTLIFEESVDPFHHDWITEVSTLTVSAFAPYIPEGTLLVVGTNQEFFEETVSSEGYPYNASAIPPGGNVCVAYQGTSWVSLNQYFASDRFPSDKNWAACIAHELFHVVQDAQDEGPGSQTLPPGHPLYRPLWLIEGSAQFMGHAIMSYAGYYEYWGTHFTAGKSVNTLERPFLRPHESWETGGFDSYKWGSLATEYIVASKGVGALIDIWSIAGQGASFEEAFEQALDISVEDFYERFDVAMRQLAAE